MDDLVALLYSHISPEARKYTPLAEKTQIICMERRKVLEAYDDQGENEAKKNNLRIGENTKPIHSLIWGGCYCYCCCGGN